MDPDPDLDLSAMMETSVKDLCVPVAVIVAESGRRGRRRRLARQLRIAGTTLAVAAIAFVGANAGLPLLAAHPRPGTGVGPAAPATATGQLAPLPTPTPSVDPDPDPDPDPGPSRSATATGADGRRQGKQFPLAPAPVLGTPRPDITAQGAPAVEFTEPSARTDLEAVLSMQQGKISQAYPVKAERGDGASEVYLAYSDKDGGGPVTVELRLGRTELPFPADGGDPGPGGAPFRCGEDSGTAGDHAPACLSGYLPNGSWELLEMDDARSTGLYSYRVAVWYPDGTVVDFTEYAGFVNNNGEPPSYVRAKPPLDPMLWRSVAESPLWTHYAPVEGRATG
ncbi:hypothetical protein [Kitasatospora phosalacinea]|uniref:Uncharacterized protein n=1 Tax=Kitasatospora phosalacinea TaxID=2065 RepID=A0A9W6PJQ6_9ACTN|nr:hypothetical protein [Kitasatospora phosalacinea]GLW56153.1 hypothetical protein Kpho01_41640 [Kitasatospora phosalacinea]